MVANAVYSDFTVFAELTDMALERLSLDSPHWITHHADHVARYLYASQHVAGKRVLDAGMGQGYGAVLLMAHGAAHVDAIDIDNDVVETAKYRFRDSGIRFLRDDCEIMAAIEGEYDVICNFENIEHLKAPRKFLSRAAELLSKDGVLMCSSPDRAITLPYLNGKPANPYHEHEWFRDDFSALLSADFGAVDCKSQIITFSASERKKYAEAYSDSLRVLRNSPLGLCRRMIAKVLKLLRLGTSQSLEYQVENALNAMSVASGLDYPIVPAAAGPFLGRAFCHFAVCKEPKRCKPMQSK